MSIDNGLIHNGHDDRRITGAEFPRRFQVDVATRLDRSHQVLIARILVVPLFVQHRVVELGGFVAARVELIALRSPNLIVRHDLLFLEVLKHVRIILHDGHFAECRQLARSLVQRDFRIEPDLVPAVQTECTGIGLILFHIREDTFHRNRSQRIERGIERLNPRTRRPGTGYPGFDGSDRLIGEFHEQLAIYGIRSRKNLAASGIKILRNTVLSGVVHTTAQRCRNQDYSNFPPNFFHTIIIQHSFLIFKNRLFSPKYKRFISKYLTSCRTITASRRSTRSLLDK